MGRDLSFGDRPFGFDGQSNEGVLLAVIDPMNVACPHPPTLRGILGVIYSITPIGYLQKRAGLRLHVAG